MTRNLATVRYLLLASESAGHLEYHLTLLRDAGLVDAEGITERGRAVLEPLRDEGTLTALKARVEAAGLEPELLLSPAISGGLSAV